MSEEVREGATPFSLGKWLRDGIPSWFEILKLGVGIALTVVLAYLTQTIAFEQAQPKVVLIGRLPQFPGDDHVRTIRIKNISSRQDAVVTGIEFIVAKRIFLDRIDKRDKFAANTPPAPSVEDILPGSEVIELKYGEWAYDGSSYKFKQDIDLHIAAGKSESLRLAIGNSRGRPGLWDRAWMEGTLLVHYDQKTLTIPRVSIVHKTTNVTPDIPPKW